MALVGGGKLATDRPELHDIESVIFPHPASASVGRSSRTVLDYSLAAKIIATTQYLVSARVDVRWYDDLIGNAIIIADQDSKSGWAQIETVLSHARQSDRQCLASGTRDTKE